MIHYHAWTVVGPQIRRSTYYDRQEDAIKYACRDAFKRALDSRESTSPLGNEVKPEMTEAEAWDLLVRRGCRLVLLEVKEVDVKEVEG